jgi:hypothetical protein
MCVICVELEAGKLTPLEAKRNLGEIVGLLDNEHLIEVEEIIAILEQIEKELSEEEDCCGRCFDCDCDI